MGFCFDFHFNCCSCNKETDLFKSTNLNYTDTKFNNDTNGEDNIKENNKSKINSSNGYSRKNFKDSYFQCPQQNNDNENENENGYLNQIS